MQQWNSDTKRFKRFLEQNKGDIQNMSIEVGEVNFYFKKVQAHIVTIKTTKGEYKFSVNMEFAEYLANIDSKLPT